MKLIPDKPDLQIWVCVNERFKTDSLPSCTLKQGSEIYQRLCAETAKIAALKGLSIWVNRTLCQGFCSSEGVTLSVEPLELKWQGVRLENLPLLISEILKSLHNAQLKK